MKSVVHAPAPRKLFEPRPRRCSRLVRLSCSPHTALLSFLAPGHLLHTRLRSLRHLA